MKSIPKYALYGDGVQTTWSNSYYFEWIPSRASAYKWEIQPHVHEAFIQLLYFRAGTADAVLNGVRYEVRSPSVVLIPAQTVHGFHFSDDVDGPVITASQRMLESLAAVAMPELAEVMRKPALIALDESARYAAPLLPLFLAVEREYQMNAPGQMAAAMSHIIALLVQLARLGPGMHESNRRAGSRSAERVERFQEMVEQRFRSRIPLAAYAVSIGITTGHLTRMCRDILGMSAIDVVNLRVVQEAQRELIYTSAPVKRLAAALGFEDEAYFSRFFKKHAGIAPKEFRANALRDMSAPSPRLADFPQARRTFSV